MRVRSLFLALLAIVLVAAACGGDDDDMAAETPATTAAAPAPPPEPPPAAAEAPSGTPTPNNGEQFVVAWTPYTDPTNDLNVAFDNQVKKTIEDAGMKHIYCSGKATAVDQANCIDQFIAQNVDIILIYPADVDSMAEKIKDANTAGIPVGSFFGNIPDVGQEQLYTLTIPVYDAGVLNGMKLVEYLTEKNGEPKGTVLEITGLMTTSQAQDRNAGFHSIVDDYADIEVTVRNGDYDTAKAGTITTDWFTVNSDTDAIYIHSNCDYTPSVRSALEALDLYVPKAEPGHIAIFGTDGCNSSLHEVRCGFQDYGTTYPTDKAAAQMAQIATNYLQTGESPQPGEVVSIPGLEGGTTAMVEGSGGPIYFMELIEYTQDTANDPTLFGNSFMSEPNGLTACDDR